MELKTEMKKKQGCQRPPCFLSSPKANYVHKITYQIIDVKSSSDVISFYQCLLGYITLKSSRNCYNRGTATIFSQVVKNK